MNLSCETFYGEMMGSGTTIDRNWSCIVTVGEDLTQNRTVQKVRVMRHT